MITRTFFTAATIAAVTLATTGPALAANADPAVDNGPKASYIVQFTAGTDNDAEVAKAKADGATVKHQYKKALNGMAVELSPGQLKKLKADPNVVSIEADGPVQAYDTQNGATWGLDRIDQRNLPLDSAYTYATTATNVTAYIIDTGINVNHQEFAGRTAPGYDAVTAGGTAADCNGHGTHVAGTVGGSTYGVAKGVTLVPVRVLDCAGSGSFSGVIAGIDWVAANAKKPAVANMSLGGGYYSPVNTAVANAVAAGVTFAVAAGNSNADACASSPSSTPEAITVGATTSTDARASYSNFGTCLDVFAPGSSITSSWFTSNTATNTISGTSMASPHVAGAAALYLAANPGATPQQVRDALVGNGTTGVVGSAGTGSPNVLLFTDGGPVTPPPAPTISGFTPASGYPGSSVTVSGTNLAGATAKVNTTAATVTASSATSLTLTVPAGATTGPISVTTSGGTATSATNYTVLVATVPGAPTIGTATAGTSRNATVRWTLGSNGGSALTGQTIRIFQGATSTTVWRTMTVSATATSANVTSLTRGQVYRFTVSATNGVGAGPQSAYSNTITAR